MAAQRFPGFSSESLLRGPSSPVIPSSLFWMSPCRALARFTTLVVIDHLHPLPGPSRNANPQVTPESAPVSDNKTSRAMRSIHLASKADPRNPHRSCTITPHTKTRPDPLLRVGFHLVSPPFKYSGTRNGLTPPPTSPLLPRSCQYASAVTPLCLRT
jgi:hypothetical protein